VYVRCSPLDPAASARLVVILACSAAAIYGRSPTATATLKAPLMNILLLGSQKRKRRDIPHQKFHTGAHVQSKGHQTRAFFFFLVQMISEAMRCVTFMTYLRVSGCQTHKVQPLTPKFLPQIGRNLLASIPKRSILLSRMPSDRVSLFVLVLVSSEMHRLMCSVRLLHRPWRGFCRPAR